MHSQQCCTFGLLSTADFRNLAARDDWIEATCLTVRQDAVRDFGLSVRPPSDRATSPKLSVIRVSDNDQHPVGRLAWHIPHVAPLNSHLLSVVPPPSLQGPGQMRSRSGPPKLSPRADSAPPGVTKVSGC